MNLKTTYLGLPLAHPFMPGASPLVDDIDVVKQLEDAGASAIVMHSLFQEQIAREQWASFRATEPHGESFAEAMSYFPRREDFSLGPDAYLDQIRKIKVTVRVPVIASLNGTTLGGWLDTAGLIEQAGADAIELNVYSVPTDGGENAETIEDRTIEMLRAVKAAVRIPVALKLSPFYTSLAHFVRRADEAGADGVILFNRFYQPDLDPDDLCVVRTLALSHPSELPLRLRWLGVLSGRTSASLAASGGVHTFRDALKAIAAGAHAVQLVSALLRHGPEHLRTVRQEVVEWMEEKGYESVDQLRGSLSLASCPDPKVYERANYMLVLQSWNARGAEAR